MAATASIIVLAHGNRPATERCLKTLAGALGDELGRSFELVLVDNDSPDDTAELFSMWSTRAVVVSLPENRNFAGGCNAGARAASGEILVFLNNDTEVPAGALETIVEQALEPNVGAVGARLLYPDGTLQHGGVVHREAQPGLVIPFHLFHHEPGDLPQACATYDVDVVTGACLATPRAVFEELGGFDEAYVNGLEDVDLCLRVRTTGRRVVYRGDVHLLHHERLTRGATHDETENLRVFQERWHGLLDDDADHVASLFDIRFDETRKLQIPGDHAAGALVAVEGRLRSVAPEAFEARALLTALLEAGVDTAARDWGPTWESPRDGRPWNAIAAAGERLRHPAAVTIQVPAGRLFSLPAGSATVARLAAPPRSGGALSVGAVWAASPALIDELVAGGFPADRAVWLPPLLPDVAPGPGGEGILALLPSHDLQACAALLDALASFGEQRIRLVPTVAGPLVAELVVSRLPGAEFLVPYSSEAVFAALARECDVVCGGDGDPFERRPLIAAATGTAVVTSAAGPAAAVLGTETATRMTDPAAIRSAVERSLELATLREARAGLVRAACGPGAVHERLRGLIEELVSARRVPDLLAPARAPLPA